jgi:hypothetical protein
MNALLLLIGFIAGVAATVIMTHKIDRDVPAEIAAQPKKDPFDISIDAVEQWNRALLNVPIVQRPMVWKETRQ